MVTPKQIFASLILLLSSIFLLLDIGFDVALARYYYYDATKISPQLTLDFLMFIFKNTFCIYASVSKGSNCYMNNIFANIKQLSHSHQKYLHDMETMQKSSPVFVSVFLKKRSYFVLSQNFSMPNLGEIKNGGFLKPFF